MDAKQHLYYALGILAYAVAKADGKVQREEKETLHEIVAGESGHSIDFSYAEIIFDLLQKDRGFDHVYDWAMKGFETGKHHFSDKMKEEFISIMQKVADAFPPTTEEEKNLIDRFSREIWEMKVNKVID